MATEQVPTPCPPGPQWFARLGLSGKLLVIGGAVGVIAVFLPLVSISVQAPNPGAAFGIPGMPAGVNMPALNVTQHAMVIDSWQGKIGLAVYVAALVLAFVLYPPTGLAQKTLAWAGVGVGGIGVALALWLLFIAMRSGNDVVAGMFGANVSVGIGAFANVLAAGTVAAGGFLKAREERLI